MAARVQQRNKKLAILESALELIAENGFHGAPTSQIAEKARVGVGSIYRYFKDKDDLIHQVFERVLEQMSQAILHDHDPNAPVREQYVRLGLNTFRFMVENPKAWAFTEQYCHSPFGLSHRREVWLVDKETGGPRKFNALHAILEPARAQGQVKDLPLAALGALTFGPIVFLVRDVCAGLVELDPDTIRKTVEACWDAVKR